MPSDNLKPPRRRIRLAKKGFDGSPPSERSPFSLPSITKEARLAAARLGVSAPPRYESLDRERNKDFTQSCMGTEQELQLVGKWLVEIIFIPETNQLEALLPFNKVNRDIFAFGLDFVAHLLIETIDLPRLFSDGFFLRDEHLQKEFSYYIWGDHPRTGIQCHCRSFTITDPIWTGELRIYSTSLGSIRDFTVSSLSPETIINATATIAGTGDIVYNYGRHLDEHNINCCCGDQPLKGLWPWPKEEQAKDATSGGVCNLRRTIALDISNHIYILKDKYKKRGE